MSRHGDREHLEYIDECITTIQASGVAEMGPEAFAADSLVADATLRRLQTVCESSKDLSEDLKRAYPDLPWREMRGFRNHLSHGHLDVNLDVVWDATRKLEPLQEMARHELGVQQRRRLDPPSAVEDLALGL